MKLLKTYVRLILETRVSLTPHYYHGSNVSHELGTVLKARVRRTEFSNKHDIDGINLEDFIDSFRPGSAVPRSQCIFVVDDPDDLNIAGASEDYVYEVKPIGKLTKCHFSWFSELLGLLFDKESLTDNSKAAELAKGYWSGQPFKRTSNSNPAVQEYLCEAVKIISLIE